MTAQEKYHERSQIITDATALKEPKRVPCCPQIAEYPYNAYGSSPRENMYDIQKAHEAVVKFYEEFETDGAYHGNPSLFEGHAMDLMQPRFLRWPGAKDGILADHQGYQFLEDHFPLIRDDDEWEEVLTDTTKFLLTKYFPRQYKTLEPFEYTELNMGALIGFHTLAGFATEDMQEALQKLGQAIPLMTQYMIKTAILENRLKNMGYPEMIEGMAMAPLDVLGDFCLGTEETLISMIERPEQMLALIEKITDVCVAQAYATGDSDHPGKRIWFQLHKGMDSFMSSENYEKFYWNPMRKVIDAVIAVGNTPVLMCQGSYYTRFPFLRTLPKGKCICAFEKMDMAIAKKELNGIACIMGNLDASLLAFGRPEQIADECKRLIDICAPGGGYLFGTSASVDVAKKENIAAMINTVLTYGAK